MANKTLATRQKMMHFRVEAARGPRNRLAGATRQRVAAVRIKSAAPPPGAARNRQRTS